MVKFLSKLRGRFLTSIIFILVSISCITAYGMFHLTSQSQDIADSIQLDINTLSNRLILEQSLNREIETYIELGYNYPAVADLARSIELNTHLKHTDTFISNELKKIQILIDNIRTTQNLVLSVKRNPDFFKSAKGLSTIQFSTEAINRTEYKRYFQHLSSDILSLIKYQYNYSKALQNKILTGYSIYLTMFLCTFVLIVLLVLYLNINHVKQTKKLFYLKQEQYVKEQNDKDREAFLSNISHEIRTPLNGLYGVIQSIDENINEPSKIKSFIHTALQSYDHIIYIVDSILNLSKDKYEEEPINLRPFYLADVMDLILHEQESTAERKGLSLTSHVPESEALTKRMIDPIKLSQIIRNLLHNAIKFTNKGTITLNVESLNINDQVKITITDTGIGIPKDMQEIIFEAFQQVDSKLNKQYSGTGLGLFIVSSLVKRMGGKIDIYSEPNEGTTFDVIIPMQITQEPKKEPDIIQNIPQDLSADINILVVEDNDVNRMIFCKLLEKEQVKITEAIDGYACLEIVENNSFDIIFLDIQMPGLDGIKTFELLQKMNISTPIIALTGNVMPNHISQYYETGFTNVLAKPYKRSQLIDMIFKYTKNHPKSI